MTTLSMPSATSTYIPAMVGGARSGSHRVDEMPNGRVMLRDVELFAETEEGDLGTVDGDKLREIAANTNARMGTGFSPRVVLTHSDDAPVVGRIASAVSVRSCPSTGLITLYGDMEMTASDFEALIASNRYPGRSAEIRKNNLILHGVALLGREAPGVVIPDTMFSGDPPVRCAAKLPIIKFQAESAMDKLIQLMTVMSEVLAALPENERAEAIEKIKKSLTSGGSDAPKSDAKEDAPANNEAEDDKPKPEEGDRKEDEPMSQNSANTDTLAKYEEKLSALSTQVDTLKAARDQDRATISALTDRLTREKYQQKLCLYRDVRGFSTVNVDTELTKLVGMKDDTERDAHFEFIEKNYKQTLTGASLVNAQHIHAGMTSATVPGDQPKGMTAAEKDAIVSFCSKNPSVSFDEAKAKLAKGEITVNSRAA